MLTDNERGNLLKFIGRAAWLGARDAEDREPEGAALIEALGKGKIKLKNGDIYHIDIVEAHPEGATT